MLLQGIYGVLLSASVGAFTAAAYRHCSSRQAKATRRARSGWSSPGSTIIVTLDAWYQCSLHGIHLRLGQGKFKAWLIFGLVISMIVRSFLPFQFLVQVLETDSASWLGNQPALRLFTISL